ncbi:sulfite exporter TauE/SafE family protein [Serratia nevei]|uniref:sulfite exporter TauE/SafE family protein n=1 Tax=Serratia nevei TaxID=2703794 RepID=UPI00249BF118|nr:sulfite exporter TauE/SafE family protein [Serratia nevei]MDI3147871.1 sulfite exporter TauE/SafE family protein [Serratia nevei]
MSLTLLEIIALTGIFTLAGTVKGAIGLGLPTVSMGLLSLMMPPGQAAALLLLPSLVTNLWQLLCGPRLGALCRRLWPMMLCVTLGTLLSAGALTATDGRLALVALGVCLIGYALLGFTRFDWRVSATAEPWLGPLCGLVTGALTGATGVFVIPAVPYLNALGLARDDLVLALAAGLAWHQALPGALLGGSLLALLPALGGMWLGGIVRRHSSPLIFRRLFFIGLLILGIEIVWRSIN